MKKVTKHNLRTISKQYAHLQAMTSTPVKFQRNQIKTVVGVAYTRCIVSVFFSQKNDRVHFVKKVTKNNLRIISKQYAHSRTIT